MRLSGQDGRIFPASDHEAGLRFLDEKYGIAVVENADIGTELPGESAGVMQRIGKSQIANAVGRLGVVRRKDGRGGACAMNGDRNLIRSRTRTQMKASHDRHRTVLSPYEPGPLRTDESGSTR